MLDRTVKAFALFCSDKPDAVLYLHSDMYDAAAVFDLRDLIRRYKLENRVCFSKMRFFENFEISEMNNVYNVMDVFFLSTSGEGFGVPTIEALSCEVPVVATDYTTTQELLVDDGVCGLPVKVVTELTGSWTVERAIMDIPDAVVQLNKLYEDREFAKKLGRAGREKVIKLYSWDVVIPLWKKLFLEMGA